MKKIVAMQLLLPVLFREPKQTFKEPIKTTLCIVLIRSRIRLPLWQGQVRSISSVNTKLLLSKDKTLQVSMIQLGRRAWVARVRPLRLIQILFWFKH